MNQLKCNGIPTRKTKGALGDIYTDTSTGKKYKCVFSYRDNDDADFDCQWKELNNEKTVQEGKFVVKPVVEEKPVEKKEVKKPVAEEVKEEVKPKPHTGKTNYAAYSKKQ